MRILVLGGDGMLGHQLLRTLAATHEVKATLRQPLQAYARSRLFSEANAYGDIDARSPEKLHQVLSTFRPDAVVNAIGLVTQRSGEQDTAAHLEINALFPHRLAQMCAEAGARLIHISSDAVFSGERGDYRETDRPDPLDTYGRCKLLGEVAGAGQLTLRAAIVGLGLTRRTGLVDWLLQQEGRIRGYTRALFSGPTTHELARVIGRLLVEFPGASGLYHVSAAALSKFDFLIQLRDRLALPIEIVPDEAVRIDRTLDSTRFRGEFSYAPPSWDRMLDELVNDIRMRRA
jgi:dTDP-4-dehydrorhamnose reductase